VTGIQLYPTLESEKHCSKFDGKIWAGAESTMRMLDLEMGCIGIELEISVRVWELAMRAQPS
jgi:hypothetical protein